MTMKVTMTSLLLLCFFACGLESKSMSEGDKVDAAPAAPAAEQLDTYSKAYFASGCFWCVEAIYESVKGVIEVESGYSGGKESNPTYEQVGAGRTGHAEAVVVYYDPAVVDFATLVDVYYGSQDPTTVNGQAPDFGRQYRSIIFYSNESERLIAEEKKRALGESGMYSAPIATEIVAFEKFWPAEDYHQNYEKLHPDNGYVMKISVPRLNRFKAKFPDLLK
jgi:peptide-methionine (S)-S-oxide reductase